MPTKEEQARVLIVLGGARLEHGLCYSLLGVLQQELSRRQVETRTHDLLADGFDPVLRLSAQEPYATACPVKQDPLCARYQEDARWANVYIFVHPVWWFAPPAILKGWVDRVFVHGVSIEQHAGGSPTPLLNGRKALLVMTFNAKKLIDRTVFKSACRFFWKRIALSAAGILRTRSVEIYNVQKMTAARFEKQSARLLRELGELLD